MSTSTSILTLKRLRQGLCLFTLLLCLGCAPQKVRVIGHWNKTIPEEVYPNETIYLAKATVADSAKPTLTHLNWNDSEFVEALDQELRYQLATLRLNVVTDSAAAAIRLNLQIAECGVSTDSSQGIQSGWVFAGRKNRKLIRKMEFEELYTRAEKIPPQFLKLHVLRTLANNIVSQTLHLDLSNGRDKAEVPLQMIY